MASGVLRVASGLIACLALIGGQARADGVPAYYDSTGWHLVPERAQFAVVRLVDGRQTLLLQVALSRDATPESAERLAWVTPLPARASTVQVDVLRGFPHFDGVEPVAYLSSAVRRFFWQLAVTQIYPAFVYEFFLRYGMNATALAGSEDVTIYERVTKDGIALEVIEAPSVEALSAYLKEKDIALPRAALGTLGAYTGPEASLVVFKIADLGAYRRAISEEQLRDQVLGVEIVFPSEQGFFPLVASSALPGGHLDVVVTAVGFHHAMEPRPPGLWTEYYLGHASGTRQALDAAGLDGSAREELRYTRFLISAKPSALNADLRFGPGGPPEVERAATWLVDPTRRAVAWRLWFALHILLSVLASLAVRRLWPAGARPGRMGAAALGLANLGTWVGYLIAVAIVGHRRKVRLLRRLAVGCAFSLVYCGGVAALSGLTLAIW